MNNTAVKSALCFILLILNFFSMPLHATDHLVTFGIDSNFPPYSYVANKTAQGYENELISLIFEKGGYKLDFKYGYSWDDIYNQTSNNKMDICGTLVRTPERAEHVLFTDDAYTRYYGVFANSSAESLDVDNLGKYRLGAVKGYYSEVIVREKLKASRYEVFNTYLQMIDALVNHRIDAFIETTEVIKYYISKHDLVGQVVLQHDGLFLQSVPFGVAKNRPDLAEFINKRLKEIRASGEYEILYIKNFSAHSPEYYESEKKRERWILIGITAGLATAALAFIVLLKFQIKKATKKIIQSESEIKIKNQELEALNEELNATIEEMESTNDELIQREAELRENELHFRTLSDSGQALIWTAGIDKKCFYFNQPWLDFTGRTLEQEIGDGWVEGVHPDDLDKCVKIYIEAFDRREKFSMEYRLRHSDGGFRWIQDDGTPCYNSEGEFIGYIGHCLDVSERKKAEENIQNLLREKELLLQEVHHRIKNNMNTIKGLLTLQINAEENQSTKESLRDAESRVQSMIMLYDRLYFTENYREMSVKDYLQSLAEEIIGSFPNRGIVKIETDVEDFILNVNLLTPLGIIVNELLTNMMKYAFSGKDSGVLKLSAAIKDNHVTVQVCDNGIGMPESVNFNSSTGFGLNLVGMLVEQIGGRISIERRDGTKFVIEFDL